ncbi:MAG: hypothetical protein JW900_07285, partial [Anaerolineae bacterium]|nr:hypothetical protein [Anaerolineae bacterium]
GGEVVYLRLYIETAADVYLDRQDQLDVHGVTTTQVRVGGSADVYLDAGEDLDVRIYQDSGGALTLDTDSDLNHLSIHRI